MGSFGWQWLVRVLGGVDSDIVASQRMDLLVVTCGRFDMRELL